MDSKHENMQMSQATNLANVDGVINEDIQ